MGAAGADRANRALGRLAFFPAWLDFGPHLAPIGSQFTAVLQRDQPLGGFTWDGVRELIRQQALFYYFVSIILKGHLVRRWNTQPLSTAIRVGSDWPLMASVFEGNIATPGRQLAGIMTTPLPQPPAHASWTSPDLLEGSWMNEKFLIDWAEGIQSHMIARAGRSSSFASVARVTAAELERLSSFDRKSLSKQGLGRREFVTERLGIAASPCSVVLAMALLRARERIDACIAAVSEGRPIPGTFRPDFHTSAGGVSGRALLRTSIYLRRRLRMERHHQERSCGLEDTNAGRTRVATAMRAFLLTYPNDAVATLVQDPATWFA